nr:hypothetical protein B0A51_01061 [Rachicladosporium sp. CCFEE 5018]
MDESERPSKMRKISHDDAEILEVPKAILGADRSDEQTIQEANAINQNPAIPGQHDAGNDPDSIEADLDGESFPAPLDTAPSLEGVTSEANPMSKNQLKKLRKKQEWESKRDDRKTIRKEKLIAKRLRKKDAYDKAIAEGGSVATPERKETKQRAVQLPVTILIDCDFDELMRDNERISLGGQITRSYSDNKGSTYRAHLTVCSFLGKLRERFDGIMGGVYKNYRGTRFLEQDFVDVAEQAKVWMGNVGGGELKGAFEKYADSDHDLLRDQGEVVYLSSEAEETLNELKPYSTYIIGGLVDKNREKGICYKRATQRGLRTAKLPVGDYLEMSSRKVLATNHVNEIMLKWLECGDWGDAFMKVIPKRKGGKLRSGGQPSEGSECESGAETGDAAAPVAIVAE